MYIIDKPLKNRNRTLFIFRFKNQEDVDNWFYFLNDIMYNYLEKDKDGYEFKRIIEKLKNRLDNQYVTEDSEFSSSLFQDEMCYFTKYILLLSVKFHYAL